MWTIVLIDCPRFMRAVQVGVHRLSVTMPPSKRKQANKSNGKRAPQVKVARARAAAASSTASTGAALDDAMDSEPIGTPVLFRCAWLECHARSMVDTRFSPRLQCNPE